LTNPNFFDVIVIGAGPAGLMSALQLNNKRILVLEKNSKPGIKLMISGSGRCNFTHEGSIRDFLCRYGAHGRFLKHALYLFDNQKTIQFFNENGLSTVVDKNGKYFPASDRAGDVLRILMDLCREKKVEFRFESPVLEISKVDDVFQVKLTEETISASAIVIATGGKSYPKTGSNGDGFSFAKALGHSIVNPKPALTSIVYPQFPFAEISGVAIYNRVISLYRNQKKINEYKGDIGFTHKGLSGPGILDFSRYFEVGDQLKINLCNLPSDVFREKFILESRNNGKLSLKNYLKNLDVPESLVKLILEQIGIDGATTLATISKTERTTIVDNFTNLTFNIECIAGFNQAMATSGGVNLDEVNSKTMESKLIKNLYFAGEVLDIDGDSGGYNIQAAFSTGNLVAQTINNLEFCE
jgi:hypothetical protein